MAVYAWTLQSLCYRFVGMNETEVHESIVRWLNAVTGLVTIKAHQSAARPDNPYLMVNFLNLREVRENHTDVEFVDTGIPNSAGENEISISPVIQSEWEFSIHSYGNEPVTPLRKIRSMTRISGPQQLIDKSLSIFDLGAVNHVPDLIKNAWEPRAHCNLFIRGYTRDGFVIDVVDQAPINLTKEV